MKEEQFQTVRIEKNRTLELQIALVEHIKKDVRQNEFLFYFILFFF